MHAHSKPTPPFADTPTAPTGGLPSLEISHRLLATLLSLWSLALLLAWAPHYLTWPWWSDHDVFATAALAWSQANQLPYRDLQLNNFPGTIYLFYLLGAGFGWGHTSPLYAFDLALLLAFIFLAIAWSRARFASLLPGLVATVATLSYYLNLDYSQTAQRDWHAPLLALSSLMLAQSSRKALGPSVSGLVLALALSIRPQAILFAPAIAASLWWLEPGSSSQPRHPARALGFWTLGLALGGSLVLAPLARHHLIPDFIQGVRVAAYGGSYSQSTIFSIVRELARQVLQPRVSLTIILLATLSVGSRRQKQAWVALLALACVYLYRPLSPVQHAYLSHPLMLTWCWSLAVVCALIQELEPAINPARLKIVATLLLFAVACPVWPRFCNVQASLQALRGQPQSPPGYTTNPEASYAGRYDWTDYQAALDFLRRETRPTTRVANALRFAPALTGPAGRLSAFPAESTAWLAIVRPADEARFADALLERHADSVVVWDPTTPVSPPAVSLPHLEAAIRAHYEPWASFGPLQIWRLPNAFKKNFQQTR